MQVHQLLQSSGRVSKGKRLGRGNSSGKWNYCGKWVKGQKARSGGSVPAWFEGGQTPLFMRLPKYRGFKRYYKLLDAVVEINVGQLEANKKIASGDTLTRESLESLGFVTGHKTKIKLLWKWDVTKQLTITWIDACSASAKQKVEQAWGSVDVNA